MPPSRWNPTKVFSGIRGRRTQSRAVRCDSEVAQSWRRARYALTLGRTSSPHVRTQTPFPPPGGITLPPSAPPSSSSLNATASCVPSQLNASAETGAGYFGSWRRRFLATGSHSETVPSPPPVAKVPQLAHVRTTSQLTEIEFIIPEESARSCARATANSLRVESETLDRVHRVDAVNHLPVALERVLFRLDFGRRVEELDGDAAFDRGRDVACAPMKAQQKSSSTLRTRGDDI